MLKNMVVEPKMTQSIESDEEPVDLFRSIGQGVQKHSLSSRTLVQLVKIEPQLVEGQSRGDRGPTITYHALNAND